MIPSSFLLKETLKMKMIITKLLRLKDQRTTPPPSLGKRKESELLGRTQRMKMMTRTLDLIRMAISLSQIKRKETIRVEAIVNLLLRKRRKRLLMMVSQMELISIGLKLLEEKRSSKRNRKLVALMYLILEIVKRKRRRDELKKIN
jgi:hypothetical protein